MNSGDLPTRKEMITAFLASDEAYEGVFVTAVLTTGIFCRPSCSARKPKPENVLFFASTKEALIHGFRPCLRCRPLLPLGENPEWIGPLLREIEQTSQGRWKDEDLRSRGLEPERVRRWFRQNHDLTFHAYARTRRLVTAMDKLKIGGKVIDTAFESGYDSVSGFNDAFVKTLGLVPSKVNEAEVVMLTRIKTPVGLMMAGATDKGLCLLEFVDRRMLRTQLMTLQKQLKCRFVPGENEVLNQTRKELGKYFAGELMVFTVPLVLRGTEFQKKVWRKLTQIPYGVTWSYGELAQQIGQATAYRAVAMANGRNRVAIVVPCHRVIASDGGVSGYGGGVWRKRRLLEVEGVKIV